MKQALVKLENIKAECSEANWDGYGADPIDLESYQRAVEFIKICATEPDCSIEPDGCISLEWYNDRNKDVFSISLGEKIAFAGLWKDLKMHGVVEYGETLHDIIAYGIFKTFVKI